MLNEVTVTHEITAGIDVIIVQEIGKAIDRLKWDKAAGHDHMIGEFFKAGKQHIISCLLFNHTFKTTTVINGFSVAYL